MVHLPQLKELSCGACQFGVHIGFGPNNSNIQYGSCQFQVKLGPWSIVFFLRPVGQCLGRVIFSLDYVQVGLFIAHQYFPQPGFGYFRFVFFQEWVISEISINLVWICWVILGLIDGLFSSLGHVQIHLRFSHQVGTWYWLFVLEI